MLILVDMNLSPSWVPFLAEHGWQAVHWSTIGDITAPDKELMEWAACNGHIVLTHDLDFGTLLALTHRTGPSVIQARTENVLPNHLGPWIVAALRQHETDLLRGALVTVDEKRCRTRVLPL